METSPTPKYCERHLSRDALAAAVEPCWRPSSRSLGFGARDSSGQGILIWVARGVVVLLLLECLAFLLVALLSDRSPGLRDTGLAGVDTTAASTTEQIAKPRIGSLLSHSSLCVAASGTILGHLLG